MPGQISIPWLSLAHHVMSSINKKLGGNASAPRRLGEGISINTVDPISAALVFFVFVYVHHIILIIIIIGKLQLVQRTKQRYVDDKSSD